MRVFPSKLRSEIFTLTFPFGGLLDVGEEIVLAESVVTVSVGVDSAPKTVKYRSPIILANLTTVTQQARLGLPGVIYLVTVTAITNFNNEYQLQGMLAVLPDGAAIPPYFGIKYSTELYPLLPVESLQTVPSLISAEIQYIEVGYALDAVKSRSYLMDGYLPNYPWGYDQEAIQSISIIVSGVYITLNSIYTIDFMQSQSVIVSGEEYPAIPANTTVDMQSISDLISGTVSP